MNPFIEKRTRGANLPKPSRAYRHDAGYDLSACFYDFEDVPFILRPNAITKLGCGYGVDWERVPTGWHLEVRGRSGMTARNHVIVHLGTVDPGYDKEIGIIVENRSGLDFEVRHGDRIAQGVFTPYWFAKTDDLDEMPIRGGAGFGSSGV